MKGHTQYKATHCAFVRCKIKTVAVNSNNSLLITQISLFYKSSIMIDIFQGRSKCTDENFEFFQHVSVVFVFILYKESPKVEIWQC